MYRRRSFASTPSKKTEPRWFVNGCSHEDDDQRNESETETDARCLVHTNQVLLQLSRGQHSTTKTMMFFLMRHVFRHYAQLHPFPLPNDVPMLPSEIQKPRRYVTFDRVEIRVHALILGDHPCCVDGMALGLGWEHSRKKKVMHIDEFEKLKADRRPLERLSVMERKDRLKQAGGIQEQVLKKAFKDLRCKLDHIREKGIGSLLCSKEKRRNYHDL